MSIIPASALSPSDLAMLGNNLRPSHRTKGAAPASRRNHRILAAVNRSLACVGEQVSRLHRPAPAPGITRTLISGGRRGC